MAGESSPALTPEQARAVYWRAMGWEVPPGCWEDLQPDEQAAYKAMLEYATGPLERENARLREGGRMLGHVAASQARSLYATWIDLQRGDVKAAHAILAEALDGFGDAAEWNGAETGVQWLERVRGGAQAEADGIADDLAASSPAELRDVLLVIGEDVPAGVIAGWTDAQRAEVAAYAAAEHLHASDNPVKRLQRPSVLGGAR